MLFGAAKRIVQRRCAHQFEHLVDAARTRLLDLFGDRTGIDEHLIDATCAQQALAIGVPSRRRDEGTVFFAIAAAASPTEVVPPRISRRSPFSRRSDLNRRAPRRLQHFREGAECLPREFES